jgi:WD40 repeat protein
MSSMRRFLSLVACLLSVPALAADDLPPRAVARLGDYSLSPCDRIGCAVISHDGRRVATTVEQPLNLRVPKPDILITWDATTGEEKWRWEPPEGRLSCLVFSPDGKQLVVSCTVSHDQPDYVQIHDSETGKLVRRLGNFKNPVHWLQYSADGKRLHVGEDIWQSPGDRAITSWDAATGECRRAWKAPLIPPPATDKTATTWTILSGRLSADEKIILWHTEFAKERYVLRVCDADTNKELYKLENNDWSEFILSADGKRFVDLSKPACVRDTATGKVVREFKEALTRYGFAALSADGRRAVLYGDSYSSLRVYDIDAGKFLHGEKTIELHTESLKSRVSGDGKTLLVVAHDTVRLWDLETGKERAHPPGHRLPVESLWFSPDGKTLVSQCKEAICEWNVAQAAEVSRVERLQAAKGEKMLARSLDGQFVLVQNREKTPQLRESKTGKTVGTFAEHKDKKVLARFSPLGTKLALWFPLEKPELEWFDVPSGRRVGKITADYGSGEFFSPDGRLLAWTTSKDSIAVVETATGQLLPPLRLPPQHSPSSYNLLAFSADNDYLVAGEWIWTATDRRWTAHPPPVPIRVFHVRSGKEIANFFLYPEDEGKSDALHAFALSRDGRLLAVIEDLNTTFRVLEVATGRTRLVLSGHHNWLDTLAFSPDGKTLASGGWDKVIYLWDVTGARTKGPGRGTPEELGAWWGDLAGDDAVRAGEASAALVRNPERSIPFLKEHLRPVPAADEKRLARLLADLDAEAFEKREAASRELARLGELVEPGLRQALANKPSPERKRRIADLLEKLDGYALAPETLRAVRAVEALEHIGTSQARALLKALAQGAAEARQTRDAQASLARLEK